MDSRYAFANRGGLLVPVQPLDVNPVIQQDASDPLDRHPYSIDASTTLDLAILNARIKAGWVANQCRVTEPGLTHYRHNKRPVPLAMAVLFDQAMAAPIMLRWAAQIEGYELVKLNLEAS